MSLASSLDLVSYLPLPPVLYYPPAALVPTSTMASTRALTERKYFILAVHDPANGPCDEHVVFNDISTFSDFVEGIQAPIVYPGEKDLKETGLGDAQVYVSNGDQWHWRMFPSVFYVPEALYSRLSLTGEYTLERRTRKVVSRAGEIIGKCFDSDSAHLNLDAFAPGRLTDIEVARLLRINVKDLQDRVADPKKAPKASAEGIPDNRKILRIKVDNKSSFNDLSINDLTVLDERKGRYMFGAFFKVKNYWDFSIIENVRYDAKARNPHLGVDKSIEGTRFFRQAATNTIQIQGRKEPLAEIISEPGAKSLAAFCTGPLSTDEVVGLLNKDLATARKEARTPPSSRRSSPQA